MLKVEEREADSSVALRNDNKEGIEHNERLYSIRRGLWSRGETI
jgi:hemin uptake protein HemP